MERVVGGQVDDIDTVSFNLMASDLVAEWDRTMTQLRQALTRKGRLINGQPKTTYSDEKKPVVLLNVLVQGDGHSVQTSIIVYKRDLYGYSVFAEKKWYQCLDAPFEHIGAESTGFRVLYLTDQLEMERIGYKTIYDSVLGLQSNDPSKFESHFKNLCLIFIESARFTPISHLVRGNFQRTVERGILHNRCLSRVTFTDKARNLISHWGKLSKAILEYSNGTVAQFKLPDITVTLAGIEIKEDDFEAVLDVVAVVKS